MKKIMRKSTPKHLCESLHVSVLALRERKEFSTSEEEVDKKRERQWIENSTHQHHWNMYIQNTPNVSPQSIKPAVLFVAIASNTETNTTTTHSKYKKHHPCKCAY